MSASGSPSSAPMAPHFVFEQIAQRLEELQLYALGQAADIVVRLDEVCLARLRARGLDDVGVDGALREPPMRASGSSRTAPPAARARKHEPSRRTLTLLGATGDIGSQTTSFTGGGTGIGYASRSDLIDHQALFRGVGLEFNILAGQGFPASFTNLTGLQINADRVRVVPVSEPGTLGLLGLSLAGLGVMRRRRAS